PPPTDLTPFPYPTLFRSRPHEPLGSAAVSRRLLRRTVGGQRHHRRRSRQSLLPVGDLSLQLFSLEPLSLPGGVVRILRRQLGKRDRKSTRLNSSHLGISY